MGNLDLSISSSNQVESDSDLEAFANVLVHNDESVKAISAKDNEVIVVYRRPAKLFGFIPVTVKEEVEVTVDDEGEESVDIDKSWWAFLATTDLRSDELAADLESKLSSQGSLAMDANLSASAKARVLSEIQTTANALYSGSASIN
jgi:hypothetical protein